MLKIAAVLLPANTVIARGMDGRINSGFQKLVRTMKAVENTVVDIFFLTCLLADLREIYLIAWDRLL